MPAPPLPQPQMAGWLRALDVPWQALAGDNPCQRAGPRAGQVEQGSESEAHFDGPGGIPAASMSRLGLPAG